MGRPISQQVVVITGASSGIGRETALRFARAGATAVLVARNREALADVAERIERMAGRALVLPADVADWGQVQWVAEEAVRRLGRIDTWVNNAGVAVYGSFEDTTPEEFRRVVEVNLLGQVHGAKAALPYLKAAGGGTLIGIASSVGTLPVPLSTAYGASKSALIAFYRTLRLEQEHERSGVRVTIVVPPGVDTLLFDHAVTHLGVKPAPIPPVYRPRLVADAILYAAQQPARDIAVGGALALGLQLGRLFPRLLERALPPLAYTRQLTREPKSPAGPTNLWQPVPGKGAIRGGFRTVPFDPYVWLRLHPRVGAAFALAGVALTGLACAGLLWPGARRQAWRSAAGSVLRRI